MLLPLTFTANFFNSFGHKSIKTKVKLIIISKSHSRTLKTAKNVQIVRSFFFLQRLTFNFFAAFFLLLDHSNLLNFTASEMDTDFDGFINQLEQCRLSHPNAKMFILSMTAVKPVKIKPGDAANNSSNRQTNSLLLFARIFAMEIYDPEIK